MTDSASRQASHLRRTKALLGISPIFNLCFAYATESALVTGCALMLGATAFQIGLIGSVLGLGNMGVLAAPMLLRGTGGNRKRVIMALTVLRYIPWIFIAWLPLHAPAHAVWMLIGLLGLSTFFGAPCKPLTDAWASAIVPKHERSRFIGSRAGRVLVAAIIIAPLSGYLVDNIGEAKGFAVVFAIGAFVGALALPWFALAHDPGAGYDKFPGVTEQIKRSLSRPLFRRLMISLLFQGISMSVILLYSNVFFLKYLGLSYFFITTSRACGKFFKMFACFMAGRVVERHGALASLKLSQIMMFLTSGTLFFMWPGFVVMAPIFLVLQNIVTGYIGVAQQVLVMNWGDPDEQTADFTVLALTLAFSAMIGPFAAALAIQNLEAFSVSVGGRQMGAIHLVFMISAVLQALAVVVLPRARTTPEEKPTRDLVRAVARPINFMRDLWGT